MWPFKQAYYTLYTYTLSWMMLNFEKAGSIDNSFLETEGSLPVAFCLPDILPSSQKQLIFNMAECVKKRLWHWSMKPWAYLHFVSHASLVTHVLPKICLTSQIHINFFYKKWKQTTLQCFFSYPGWYNYSVNFATHFESSLRNWAQSSSPTDATLWDGIAGSWTIGSENVTGRVSRG